MTEQWPPDWDDPEPDDGHQDVELPELSAFLASVPSPALPTSFEARISAAIAAEAAARAAAVPESAAEPAADPDQAPEPAPVRDGLGAHPVTGGHGRPRRRRPRMPSAQAASWVLVACLILGGFGFLVTRGGGSSSSSDAASSASTQGPAAAPAAGSAPSEERNSSAQGDHPAADEPSASAAAGSSGFLVYSTGTAYHRSTLASQVQGQLMSFGAETPAGGTSGTGTAPVPADSASASAAASSASGSEPSSQLTGCVSTVTDGVTPTLVDKASYDGTPAYIIATPAEAWVVGLGCTADDTDLIARVALKG
jgi:hypothetical protein